MVLGFTTPQYTEHKSLGSIQRLGSQPPKSSKWDIQGDLYWGLEAPMKLCRGSSSFGKLRFRVCRLLWDCSEDSITKPGTSRLPAQGFRVNGLGFRI